LVHPASDASGIDLQATSKIRRVMAMAMIIVTTIAIERERA